ncbi:hypothetical protein MHJ85_10695 [Brevibacterium ravenspurgense]|uniref:MmeI-like N-terminal domain-containing protein n=1 Tax=Brevibacterium ravenspurgense TaxID=479117 RepID=A0A150HAV3_9MICO|nr:type IIL restriction-modification enzyme MmeI [Brevibacterium ravenspurgense]KXZ59253.1 hypothetical protein Bravens_00500 [Brevibacterium ravenspurgense]MCG7301714.1 hypothetical protein [Brevibacterium ravenspurgense]
MADKRVAARNFIDQWSAAKGYEKGETQLFWLQLLRDVLGMESTTTEVHFEVKTYRSGYIDMHVPTAKTLVEQKSRGVDLEVTLV